MVKKIKNSHDDKSEIRDLTRIENLTEFIHEKDEDVDLKFDSFSTLSTESTSTHDSPPSLPMEAVEDMSFEMEETPMEFTSEESPEEIQGEIQQEEVIEENTFGSFEEEIPEAPIFEEEKEETLEDLLAEPEEVEVIEEPYITEKFEDVKTFAQNFSYGKASIGGGNPPFTIIVRNIKYKEDAENIFDLLSEFGVVDGQNEKDTLMALELGSLIIPQISEYTAIVIAHKLRRFDLDLEVGLSDEIHPSKSGDINPRGLLKKSNLKQNQASSLKLSDIHTPINEIVVSTSSSVPGFVVDNFLGVETTFAIVEEAELEKLQYVQKVHRDQTDIIDYEHIESSDLTSEKAFKDYQNSFNLLYKDLSMQLKQKAFSQNANALLGLNFQLSPLQFERSHSRVNAWQITCSATLAVIVKENT